MCVYDYERNPKCTSNVKSRAIRPTYISRRLRIADILGLKFFSTSVLRKATATQPLLQYSRSDIMKSQEVPVARTALGTDRIVLEESSGG